MMIRYKYSLLLMLVFLVETTGLNAFELPRPEYPRPQFERSSWINLNGNWSYEFDNSRSGKEKNYKESTGFGAKITVPFCPESPLSGVIHKDFIDAMWYQRTLSIPQEWDGKRIILHFGGVDYMSEIYLDGKYVKNHFGGSSSFEVDITDFVSAGKSHNLVVYVEDDPRSRVQTAGKQSLRLHSYSCLYTRVTGIWQTVWIEAVHNEGLRSVRMKTNIDDKQVVFEPQFYALSAGNSLHVTLKDNGKVVAKKTFAAAQAATNILPMKEMKLWSPESPFLYDVEFLLTDKAGKQIDMVTSYVGMRKVELQGRAFYLNNKPYYQRLVLDQGYYPDGQWTAPTDEQLRLDVELGKQAGFNGARLHQKVFEPRYLYWADRLGYLTWGESASWGMDWTDPMAARNMIPEWIECVSRDLNAPSLIAWSPLNETWQNDIEGHRARLTNELYDITKRLDPTRPVITTSGGYHCGFTDIFAEHTYEQDPVALYNLLKVGETGTPYIQFSDKSGPYKGEMYMIDEFGGIQWIKDMVAPEVASKEEFWGYGRPPQTIEEFYRRLEDQVNVILCLDHIGGFCYTQIVDVELEKNGVYTYDRQEKFDMERIYKIFSKSREQAKREVEQLLITK